MWTFGVASLREQQAAHARADQLLARSLVGQAASFFAEGDLPEAEVLARYPDPRTGELPTRLVPIDAEGSFLVGDDGLWVDATTLQPGDVFVQLHRLPLDGS